MSDSNYMPSGRALVLRGTKRAIAREIEDSLTPEESRIREFYRELVHTRAQALGLACTFLDEPSAAWDGGCDPVLGKSYTPFWRRFLEACQANNADPVAYLVWRQTVWSPNMKLSPTEFELNYAFDQFALRDSPVELTRRKLSVMKDQLEQLHFKYVSIYGYNERAATEAAIVQGEIHAQLSPLFAYCVCVGVGLLTLAERYRGMATCEYAVSRTAIDEVWGDLIPAGLKNTQSLALLMNV